MAKRSVELSPRALRDLEKLPADAARSLLDDIEVLGASPWPGPLKVKKLRGHELYRLRTRNYRAIFELRGHKVVVLRIVDRQDFERILKTI